MNSVNDLRNSMPFRLLCLIIAGLSLTAFAGRPTNGGAYSSQVSPTDEAREAIIKAAHAFQAVKSFRIRTESYHADKHTTLLAEFVRLDRSRIITENEEAVIIGENLYYRRGAGPWNKIPDEQGRQVRALRLPETEISETLKRSKEVKFIGPDTLERFANQFTNV